MKPGDFVKTYVNGNTKVYSHQNLDSHKSIMIAPNTLGIIIECIEFQYRICFPNTIGWVSTEVVSEVL